MKFSIIIPVYNVEPYLRETLDSVANQTFGDFECICVDDGSTDGSASLIDAYVASDPRFRIVRKANGGEGSARNAGLEVAKGEWLCYLDSDDLYAPQMLEVGAELISRHSAAEMVIVNRLNFTGEPPDVEQVNVRGIACRHEDIRAVLYGPALSHGLWCGFYRRDVFGDIRFTAFKIGADRVYVAECLSRCASLVAANERLYLYRQRNGSAMNSLYDARKIEDGIGYITRYLEIVFASGKELPLSFRRILVNQMLEEMQHHVRNATDDARFDLWKKWKRAVMSLSKNGLATKWGGFVACMLRVFPCILVSGVLCELPYRLKRIGLHR